MARRLIWTSKVNSDLASIYEYWNNRNKSKRYSNKLDRKFNSISEKLIIELKIGRTIERSSLRLIPISNYLMLYSFSEEELIILRIWESRRNPKDFEQIIQD